MLTTEIRFRRQLIEGCGHDDCDRPACATFRTKNADKPARRFTSSSATAIALHLAGMPNCRQLLCIGKDGSSGLTATASIVPSRSDPSAFMQTLVNTRAFQNALSCRGRQAIRSQTLDAPLGYATFKRLQAYAPDDRRVLLENSCRDQLRRYDRLALTFLDEVPDIMPFNLSDCQRDIAYMFQTISGRPLASIEPVHAILVLKWLMYETSSGFVAACLYRGLASMMAADFKLKWATAEDAEADGLSSLDAAHCLALAFLALCALSDASFDRPGVTEMSNDPILRLTEIVCGFLSFAHLRSPTNLQGTFTELVLLDLLEFLDKMGLAYENHACDPDGEVCFKSDSSDRQPYPIRKSGREPVFELASHCSRAVLVHWTGPVFRPDSMINKMFLAIEILMKSQVRHGSPNNTSLAKYSMLLDSLHAESVCPLRIPFFKEEAISSWITKGPNDAHVFDHRWITDSTTAAEEVAKVRILRKVCMHHMQEGVIAAEVCFSLLRKALYWKRDPNASPRIPEMETLMSGMPSSSESSVQGVSRASYRCLDILVRRQYILQDALDQLWAREMRELRRPIKVNILNAGEEGLDQGGVAQEFFRLAFAEIMNPEYGLFDVDERTRLCWFSPSAVEKSHKFELIGLLFGLAVYNGFTLPVSFPGVLYAKLLGVFHIDVWYLLDWRDVSRSFDIIRDYDGDVEEDIQATYTFSFNAYGRPIVVDMLKTDGETWDPVHAIETAGSQQDLPPVTNENREHFIASYICWLTDISVRRQYRAFERGVKKILTPDLLQLLDTSTFKLVSEGDPRVSVAELQSVVRYEGYDRYDEYMQDFWSIVDTYSRDKIARLLEFVTASDRLPPTGLQDLDFVIQRNSSGADSMPHAMTCYGHLLLPHYATKELLRERLEIALANAEGFGLR